MPRKDWSKENIHSANPAALSIEDIDGGMSHLKSTSTDSLLHEYLRKERAVRNLQAELTKIEAERDSAKAAYEASKA